MWRIDMDYLIAMVKVTIGIGILMLGAMLILYPYAPWLQMLLGAILVMVGGRIAYSAVFPDGEERRR